MHIDHPMPNRRWYCLTPDRLLVGLLAAEALLERTRIT
jgi:hypothetical protein